jgi:hypothetical protein
MRPLTGLISAGCFFFFGFFFGTGSAALKWSSSVTPAGGCARKGTWIRTTANICMQYEKTLPKEQDYKSLFVGGLLWVAAHPLILKRMTVAKYHCLYFSISCTCWTHTCNIKLQVQR